MAELLEVKKLSVSFFTPAGEVQAVRDVSFSLRAGEVLAIVGESGCGKSVLCKSILHLLPPSARRKSGTIAVNGRDITQLRERELQKLRGSLFSMVFQDPMTALNPSLMASMFRPALVAPMFTELQTMSVSASARGMDSMRRRSPAEKPLWTRAV